MHALPFAFTLARARIRSRAKWTMMTRKNKKKRKLRVCLWRLYSEKWAKERRKKEEKSQATNEQRRVVSHIYQTEIWPNLTWFYNGIAPQTIYLLLAMQAHKIKRSKAMYIRRVLGVYCGRDTFQKLKQSRKKRTYTVGLDVCKEKTTKRE